MPKVFLSSIRDDLPRINQFDVQLKGHADIAIWRNQEKIYGGQKWLKVLGKVITKQEIFLPIWSKHAAVSYFVKFEWTTALALKKSIADDTPLPASIRAIHGLSISDLPKLITSLKAAPFSGTTGNTSTILGRLDQIQENTVNNYWVESHSDDFSTQANFAEAHLTTNQFTETETRLTALFDNPKLDQARKHRICPHCILASYENDPVKF